MSVPNSVEELVQLIRKSGMIDEEKLSSYLQRRQFTRGLPLDVRDFAEQMIGDGILTQFQAEQFLLGKWRGFTIGKYKLLERVGVGGMGQVFLCEHLFMRRRVAIKVLPPAKAEQPAALGRFYREARAAGSLNHPNIVRTHDIDQDGNLHFIVMDYVNGTNLLEIVKRFGPLDIGRAVSYTRQVALGLDYAFRNKIIHRDIKPGNVMIDRKGTARLLDMGLARFINDHSDQLTIKYDDKVVLGTADYVAPEQVANSHAVDIRADIYGLGATLYFLLAGHPPFPTGTVSQKLLWHRTKEPTPIRAIRPEIPEGLAAVLARMMAKDPKARYQTPAQVAAALEEWQPAVVPLPAPEEMPRLCPAVLELLRDEPESTVELPPPVPVESVRQPVPAATAPVPVAKFAPAPFAPLPAPGPQPAPSAPPPPKVVPAPFGPTGPTGPQPAPFAPTGVSPWVASADVTRPSPRPDPQVPVNTIPPPMVPRPVATASLGGPRRNPFIDTNPFAADATTSRGRTIPWFLVAGAAAALALLVVLAIKL